VAVKQVAAEKKKPSPQPAPAAATIPAKGPWIVLGLAIVIAAILRLVQLGEVPPGFHVDEASNAWNAASMWEQGIDEHGEIKPIFYEKAFGDYRSTMYLYLQLPFAALDPMTEWAARMPAALCGVFTIPLIFYVGARLFSSWVGAAAAALLALNPWHIEFTRWAHEASVTPFLSLLVVSILIWAGAGLDDDDHTVKPLRAFCAGLAAGMVCYGYAAMRIYIPILLLSLAIVTAKQWIRPQRRRDAVTLFAGLALGMGLTLGPLIWKHLTDPNLTVRARQTLIWSPSDPWTARVKKVAARYAPHFGPDFLFLHGARDPAQEGPRGFGAMHWYALPALLVGGWELILRFRQSRSARVLAVALAIYPCSDLFNMHLGVNQFRSFPGIWALIVLAAVGLVSAALWLRKTPRLALTAAGAFSLAVLSCNSLFLYRYFGEYRNSINVYQTRDLDFREACDWLRPQMKDIGAVFWTEYGTVFAYAQTRIYLKYPPAQWIKDVREVLPSKASGVVGMDLVERYGKMHFLLEDKRILPWLTEAAREYPDQRCIFIVRPNQYDFVKKYGAPIKEIRDPLGRVTLQIFQMSLGPEEESPPRRTQ
jgi:4-amino-4-deoxy-L-arabinose transferase-like glycosyltransferase